MPRPPIHPGEILAEELAEIGVSASALAREIAVPANRISQIIHGRRAITGDTALRLGHWFGTSAQFWLNLQSSTTSGWRGIRWEQRSKNYPCGRTAKRRNRRQPDRPHPPPILGISTTSLSGCNSAP